MEESVHIQCEEMCLQALLNLRCPTFMRTNLLLPDSKVSDCDETRAYLRVFLLLRGNTCVVLALHELSGVERRGLRFTVVSCYLLRRVRS